MPNAKPSPARERERVVVERDRLAKRIEVGTIGRLQEGRDALAAAHDARRRWRPRKGAEDEVLAADALLDAVLLKHLLHDPLVPASGQRAAQASTRAFLFKFEHTIPGVASRTF